MSDVAGSALRAPHPSRAASPSVFIPARIAIDKGIPLPPRKRVGRSGHYGNYITYPWRDMQVGDSFAVPLVGDRLLMQVKMNSSISQRQRHHPGPRYSYHVVVEDDVDVIRVWRTV